MRICFVAPNVYPILANKKDISIVGGAEVQQSLLARFLVQRGHQVSLVSFDFGQEENCIEAGVRVVAMKSRGPRIVLVRYIYPRLTSLWKAMSQVDADIYYQRCAGAYTGVVAAFCKRGNKRFVYACASDNDLLPGKRSIVKGWRDRQLYFYGLSSADAVVVQSDTQAGLLKSWRIRRFALIPSCHEISVRHQMHSEQTEILWVGAMRRQKRPELFLELAKRLPNKRFCMVGGPCASGTEDAFYMQLQTEAEAIPNLRFVGFVPYAEIGKYFDRASVLINTSDFEGFPNTFLQAWARRVPTVSFFDCGAKDEGGPIALPMANLDELTRKVEVLTSDDTTRLAEGMRCRRYFERTHAPSAVVTAYKQLFNGLIQATN